MDTSRLLLPLVSACLFFGALELKAQTPAPAMDGRAVRETYPTPYPPAAVEEIEAVLRRVHGYLESVTPVVVIDRDTDKEVTDLSKLPTHPAIRSGDFRVVSYEWGVTYAGMTQASEATGDARYREYAIKRLELISRLASHLKGQGSAALPTDPASARRNQLRPILAPHSLDDSGAMCAAMIKTLRAGGSQELRTWIDRYITFISTGQQRLPDGTLSRNRPMENSLWLDDLYMSVPALSQMGKLTGETRYFDDAARQLIQFNQRMFVREKGLYMHGWVEGMQEHPAFHWARANGWAVMATVELLDVLPEQHSARPRLLEILRAHARGLAQVQGHDGLWHQLLDRPDSYEETSGSAMFVFAIARAVNRGWLDSFVYGPMLSIGWNAVAQKVNPTGQVTGTCVGTGMGWEPMFYMYRPVSEYAAHGYGPVLMAGAEMITFRRGKGAELTIRDGGLHSHHTPFGL